MERLRREIDLRVATVEDEAPPPPNAKGGMIDAATFVVGALSSQAATALIGVLKAHFERQRGTEIEVEGAGLKFRLKADDARKLDMSEWKSIIDRITGAS
jgi:hypothetical protein